MLNIFIKILLLLPRLLILVFTQSFQDVIYQKKKKYLVLKNNYKKIKILGIY